MIKLQEIFYYNHFNSKWLTKIHFFNNPKADYKLLSTLVISQVINFPYAKDEFNFYKGITNIFPKRIQNSIERERQIPFLPYSLLLLTIKKWKVFNFYNTIILLQRLMPFTNLKLKSSKLNLQFTDSTSPYKVHNFCIEPCFLLLFLYFYTL